MKIGKTLWVVAVTGFMAATQALPANMNELRAAVTAANQAFSKAVAEGDANAIAALYTANARLFPPHGKTLSGHGDILQHWKEVWEMGVDGISLETEELQEFGEFAYETGHFTLTGFGGETLFKGDYLTIWKREKDAWKVHREMSTIHFSTQPDRH